LALGVVPFLVNARHPASSPAPAEACTGSPTVFAFPSGTGLPLNTRVQLLYTGQALGLSPGGGVFKLRTHGTMVNTTRNDISTTQTELVPTVNLTAATDYEVTFALPMNPATETVATRFSTGATLDTTPPVIRAGVAVVHRDARTSCDPVQWVAVPVTVTDASPCIVAAWIADGQGTLDTTKPPRFGSIALGVVALVPSDPSSVAGRSMSVMAIDAAGNRSAIVPVPKR